MKYLLTLLFCASAFGADVGESRKRDSVLIGRWLAPGTYNGTNLFDQSNSKNTARCPVNITTVKSGSRIAGFFNGTQRAELGLDKKLLSGKTSYTTCAWIYPRTINTGNVQASILVDRVGNPPNINYQFVIWQGKLQSDFWVASAQKVCQGPTVLQALTWYHAAAVYNGSSITLYLNGAFHNSANVNGTINSANGCDTGIGAYWNGSAWYSFFDGYIDDLRVYSTAMSAAEIAAIYKETLQ